MKQTVEYEHPTNEIYCWYCKRIVSCYEQQIADQHERHCPICYMLLDFMIDASVSIDQIPDLE